MSLKIEFSKKQKIMLWIAIPSVIIFYRWVSISQEVNRLTTQLQSHNSEARIEAAFSLGQMGSSASGAVSALGSAVRDPDAQIRSAATDALIRINRRDAVDILINAFEDRNAAVRLDAAEALRRVGTAKALAALQRSEEHSKRRYQRAQLSGWADGMRRQIENDKKKRYREHKRIYDPRRRSQ